MKLCKKALFGCLALLFLAFHSNTFAALTPIMERDANGNAVAVWLDYFESNILIRANTFINGSWGSPQTILSTGVNTGTPVLDVNAVDSSTISAVVVWADLSDEKTVLFSSMLPSSSGSWTSVNQVPFGTTENVNSDYRLQTFSDGSVVLIYSTYDTSSLDQPIKATKSTIDSSNTWTTPEVISG